MEAPLNNYQLDIYGRTCDPEHVPDDEQTGGGRHDTADCHRHARYATAAAAALPRSLLL